MKSALRNTSALVAFLAVSSLAAWAGAQGAAPKTTGVPAARPRLKQPKVTLLPNGWRISGGAAHHHRRSAHESRRSFRPTAIM